jgi:hypothetical protein
MAQWIKGKSGNPNGRPKRGTGLTDILREVAEQSTDGVANKNALAKRIWTEALKGEQWACTLIFNRVEGLPVARTEIETDVEIRVLYVKTDHIGIAGASRRPTESISGSTALLGAPSGPPVREVNPQQTPALP